MKKKNEWHGEFVDFDKYDRIRERIMISFKIIINILIVLVVTVGIIYFVLAYILPALSGNVSQPVVVPTPAQAASPESLGQLGIEWAEFSSELGNFAKQQWNSFRQMVPARSNK